MNRRAFVAGLGALLAAPRAAEAQQAGKIYRVGLLAHATPEAASAPMALFRQSLEQLGWLEGRNVLLELRLVERQDQLARAACPSPKPHPAQLTTADALATG
jgi:putative ABC transport system substrate-binding protein